MHEYVLAKEQRCSLVVSVADCLRLQQTIGQHPKVNVIWSLNESGTYDVEIVIHEITAVIGTMEELK